MGFEPTGRGSNASLNSHCEITDESSGLSEPVSSLHKEDNVNAETRQGVAVPRAEVFLIPPLAFGIRDTKEP